MASRRTSAFPRLSIAAGWRATTVEGEGSFAVLASESGILPYPTVVILSAQRMQRLAEKLQKMESSVEKGGSELEDVREEVTGHAPPPEESVFQEELASVAGRVGVELKTARQLDAATLSRVLSRGPGGAGGRIWAAAEILFVDGLAARARGQESAARSRWEKAAALYRRCGTGLELPEDSASPEERLQRIASWIDE